MNKKLTFLLALTFLFLFSSGVSGDDFQDATDAYERKDYEEAVKWFRLAAEKRFADLGVFFDKGWEAFKGNLKEFF